MPCRQRSLPNPASIFLLGLSVVFILLQGCEEEQTTLGALALGVADTWLETVAPEQNDWSWGDGVLMFGLAEVARTSDSSEYWSYMGQWMDHHIGQGYYYAFSDNCPPGIAAVRLYAHTGQERYHEVTDGMWHYLQNVATRTSDGGINHMGFLSGFQLWVDSLFMFGIALNEMAQQDEEPAYWEELLDQIHVFARHLRDPDTGLFRHMWDDKTQTAKPPEANFWARGNAWVFVTLVELLSALPADHARRAEPQAILEDMASAVAGLQDDSGLWHTLLNVSDTYLETSASALFAYGFHKAMRLGILDPLYATQVDKAAVGLPGTLKWDCWDRLVVTGTSHGTSPGDKDYYAGVSVGDQVPYGVGAFLLAAVELHDRIVPLPAVRQDQCPYIAETPQSAEEFLDRAIYRLGQADLEGAEADFQAAADLAPEKGAGHFGLGLVELIFTLLKVFDGITLYSIDEINVDEFTALITSETIPSLDRIIGRLTLAMKDGSLQIDIPMLQINRRGLYTPVMGLSFNFFTSLLALLALNVLKLVANLLPWLLPILL